MILSLETAVGSGSVALLRGSDTVAQTDDSFPNASRAEEVLEAIHSLMQTADVALKDLDGIAVSIGAGSYSGIRIGLSTAIGLKNSLGIDCRGVPLLEAIANDPANVSESGIIAAVPVGKNDLAWQRFDRMSGGVRAVSQPSIVSISEFENAIRKSDPLVVLAPQTPSSSQREWVTRSRVSLPDELPCRRVL